MGRELVQLEGFDGLDAKLAALPGRVAGPAAVRGMKRAAEPMAEAMRRHAPVGTTGNLRGSIRVSAKRRNLTGLADYAAVLRSGGSGGDAVAALRSARRSGPSAGTRIFLLIGSTSPLARLFEYGTVERFHKSGKSVGALPMVPFVRPAFDEQKGFALAAIREGLTIEIRKAGERAARRAARGG